MSLTQIEKIRELLKQEEDRKNGAQNRQNNNLDKTIYPFWDIAENTNTTIRFAPDADPNNPYFWVERIMIHLPFPGIKGQIGGKPVEVRVPCMTMFGDKDDPIIAETRPWWDIDDLKEKARQYWMKRSYFYQGFVVKDGLNEENPPEKLLRRFIIGPQIHQIVKAYILDADVQEMPTDYVNGVDFRIAKTMKGKHADYSTSTWARTSRPLDERCMDAIEQHGLYDLKDFLPKRPTAEEQAIIKEMFEASVNEELYDEERWGKYYRPFGARDDESSTASASPRVAKVEPRVSAPVSAPVVDDVADDYAPFDTPTQVATTAAPAQSEPKKSTDQILQMIRNRQGQ